MSLSAKIDDAYSKWLTGNQCSERRSQRAMFQALIPFFDFPENNAACLAIEAPTGTGKTLAYLIAGLVAAREQKKTLLISTATIALQEQLCQRELPDIQRLCGLEFSFKLAKGRARYVCLQRLNEHLAEKQKTLNDYPELTNSSKILPPKPALRDAMHQALQDKSWDGERESWPEALDDSTWRGLTATYEQCASRDCQWYEECIYYKMRRQLFDADCIVSNHDLSLSSLITDAQLLPPLEHLICVFDEAHHLPEKTRAHAHNKLSMDRAFKVLEQLGSAITEVVKRSDGEDVLHSYNGDIQNDLSACSERLYDLSYALSEQFAAGSLEEIHYRPERGQAYFPGGQLPSHLCAFSDAAYKAIERVHKFCSQLLERLRANPQATKQNWLAIFTSACAYLEEISSLLLVFAAAFEEQETRWACWIEWHKAPGATKKNALSAAGLELYAAPITVTKTLEDSLWSKAHAIVLTSATLATDNGMEFFAHQCGLPANAQLTIIEGDFDYSQALFCVPEQAVEPNRNNEQAHIEQLVELVFEQAQPGEGMLVLFSSWRQLNLAKKFFAEFKDSSLADAVFAQGDYASKKQLIEAHCQAVRRGDRAVIFGLASFAEGVDLPGDYCRHVVIAKLPFSPPFDPISKTQSEWMEERGENPFMDLQVPAAALKLKQAAGRLLRRAEDSGRITLLDPRIVRKPYGRSFFKALPPFRYDLPDGMRRTRNSKGK